MTPEIPFVDLVAGQEEIAAELDAAVSRVIASGRYLLGPELERFEREFADFCEAGYCVGVGSGLAALELTLRAAGIGPGDEVIVPGYTWVATWLAVTALGATPVGVDVDPATYNIDVAAAAAAVGPRTAAIVPVHMRGEPADMDPLVALARSHDLFLLEDAAQAHGARYRGRRAGAIGDAATFSFYPAKNLGALGDGGAIVTDDEELAARLRRLRNYGMRDRYEIEEAGTNSRLNEISAAALAAKLPRLDAWNAVRRDHAAGYREGLAGAASLRLPQPPGWAEPVWHLFVVAHPDRDSCRAALVERGIQTLVHYPVLPHNSPAYPPGSWVGEEMAVADELSRTSFTLPLYPQMSAAARETVVAALLELA